MSCVWEQFKTWVKIVFGVFASTTEWELSVNMLWIIYQKSDVRWVKKISRLFWSQNCWQYPSLLLIYLHQCIDNLMCLVPTQPKMPDLIQVVDFTSLMQFANKLYQACRLHQIASSLWTSSTWYLQTCCKLMKQQASSLNLRSQLATSLLTTCNRLVMGILISAWC